MTRHLILSVPLLTCITLGGCASTGWRPSAAVAARSAEVEALINTRGEQLDAMLSDNDTQDDNTQPMSWYNIEVRKRFVSLDLARMRLELTPPEGMSRAEIESRLLPAYDQLEQLALWEGRASWDEGGLDERSKAMLAAMDRTIAGLEPTRWR